MDGRTRPTHFAADGQRCSPEGTFLVGGFVLAYPGDPAGPPQEVRNCRCRVGMVEEGQPMPPEMKRTPRQKQEIARRTAAGIVRAREDPNGIGYITVMSDDSKPERPRTASAGQETDMTTTSVIGVDQEQEPVTYRVFSDAVVAFLGVPTSDNRLLQADMDLRFRAFPLPLMWCKQSKEGHADSYTVGVIESGRVEDGKVYASGYMLNSPEADEAVELLSHGVTRPSVDLASAEWAMTDEAGVVITEEQAYALPADAKVFTAFSAAELIGTTLVSTPAFGDTSLALGDTREPRDSTLVASAAAHVAPRTYPAEFFTDPHLTEPTMPTMDPGGRIYGHVACWGQCHRSVQASCVTAPASPTNYSHFHTSSVRTDDGLRLPVGRLTIGTGHASDKLAGVPAQAHYDDTGSCWALVKVGEDAHGIWFSGVAAPWATPEQVEAGLCAPLSGDWRDFGQGLELVAALSVNTPGFVARGREDDLGRPVTLVASLGPHADREPRSIRDDVKAAVREALAEQQLTARRDAALARAEKLGPPPSPRERIEKLLTRAGL